MASHTAVSLSLDKIEQEHELTVLLQHLHHLTRGERTGGKEDQSGGDRRGGDQRGGDQRGGDQRGGDQRGGAATAQTL